MACVNCKSKALGSWLGIFCKQTFLSLAQEFETLTLTCKI